LPVSEKNVFPTFSEILCPVSVQVSHSVFLRECCDGTGQTQTLNMSNTLIMENSGNRQGNVREKL